MVGFVGKAVTLFWRRRDFQYGTLCKTTWNCSTDRLSLINQEQDRSLRETPFFSFDYTTIMLDHPNWRSGLLPKKVVPVMATIRIDFRFSPSLRPTKCSSCVLNLM